MNIMKKIAVFLLAFATAICAFGCTRVDPGTMDELKGTYQLTQYYRTYPETSDEQSARKDFIEEKQIEAYLVIDGSAYGYLIYKDNETALSCNRVHITYSYSQDEADTIRTIEYQTADLTKTHVIQYGNLGFLARERQLNQQLPSMGIIDGSLKVRYTDYTLFTWADKATDLSYVAKQLGEIPAFADYGMTLYDGQLRLMNEDRSESKYLYYIMEIDAVAKKANVYYALKSDAKRVVLTDVPVSCELSENGLYVKTVSVGDKRFNAFTNEASLQEELTDVAEWTVFLQYEHFDEDIETYIQQALDQFSENQSV